MGRQHKDLEMLIRQDWNVFINYYGLFEWNGYSVHKDIAALRAFKVYVSSTARKINGKRKYPYCCGSISEIGQPYKVSVDESTYRKILRSERGLWDNELRLGPKAITKSRQGFIVFCKSLGASIDYWPQPAIKIESNPRTESNNDKFGMDYQSRFNIDW